MTVISQTFQIQEQKISRIIAKIIHAKKQQQQSLTVILVAIKMDMTVTFRKPRHR